MKDQATYSESASASSGGQPREGELRRRELLQPHERAALVPSMPAEAYRSFRADVQRRGLLVPLDITADDVVLDGVTRLQVANELGLEFVPVRVVQVGDELEYAILAAIE